MRYLQYSYFRVSSLSSIVLAVTFHLLDIVKLLYSIVELSQR